jgi:serine/threonine-protein kinase PpkA
VQEARANNQDFDEDAIAGLKLALDKVNWQDFAGRYIVLITDAGTRDANDRLSETHLGIAEIKALARSEAKQVSIAAFHLKTPEGVANHARAERQYRELTEFGAAGSLYYPVTVGSPAEFRQNIDLMADGLLASVGQTVGRPIAVPTAQTEMGRQILRQVQVVSTAMRLSYLGRTRAQGVPDMVRSFVLDEDPADPVPARKPLDVRVLLTKNQLSDLAKTVRTIVDAANANRMSPENFFAQVRAASTASVRDPHRMAESQRLAGAFADFLKDLPYESPVMEITPAQWKDEMAPSERRELINALDAKMRLYEELNSESSLWVGFDGRQGTGDAFYPVPIDQLP